MNEDFQIFKASRLNFTDVKNLMLLALKEDPLGFGSSFGEYNNNSDYWWISYIEPYISGDRDVMFLAKQNNKIVGMAGILYNFQERKKHVALIAWVYVIKEFRRRGLSKLLMNSIIEEARMRGTIDKLVLYVNATQQEALNLYRKFGFEHSGTLKKDLKINGEYIDTNIMELFLKSLSELK